MRYLVITRKRVWEILEVGREGDRVSRWVDGLLLLLIALNVLAVILESVPALAAQYGVAFHWFDTFSVLVFSVEYLARVWSAVEDPRRTRFRHPVRGRLRFMLTPMAVIDLLVILPFYLAFFVQIDLRFMRVLRLLRVFKLTRYSASMSLLMGVLKRELQSIGAALFVLLLLVVVASGLTYIVEHKVQPEEFGSIPAAMWWAVVTMTTVGYGDVVPVTGLGKFFAATISILSMGMVALPAGLLASGFMEALRERREQYTELVESALQDGVIDSSEQQLLQHMRDSLGMSDAEAEKIIEQSRREGEKRAADLEFIAKVEAAYASGEISEAEAHAIEEAGLTLGIGRLEAHKIMRIFKKHLRQAHCPHCGLPMHGGQHQGGKAG